MHHARAPPSTEVGPYIGLHEDIMFIECYLIFWTSVVPRPHAPPGEKRSGEQSRISWACYPKRVMTNEIARLVIIT